MVELDNKKTIDNPVSVKNIDFLLNSNATENCERVIDILKIIFPQEFNFKDIKIQNIIGGYGNPVKVLSLSTNNKEEIEYLIGKFGLLLPEFDKIKLSREFIRRLDEKKVFHFKLKKSSLAKGKLEVFDRSDTIQISISFYFPKTNKTKVNFVDLIEYYLIEKKILIEK